MNVFLTAQEWHVHVLHHVAVNLKWRILEGDPFAILSSPEPDCRLGKQIMHRNVQVEEVDAAERCVKLSGIDLVDGTPVLDIKPYVPYYDRPRATSPDTHSGETYAEHGDCVRVAVSKLSSSLGLKPPALSGPSVAVARALDVRARPFAERGHLQ